MPAPLAEAQHAQRADRHYEVGVALHDAAGNEWAAVAYFYTAYHVVKCAMGNDPVWSDPSRLHALHYNLTDFDRYTTSHHGHKGAGSKRVWGVNELVALLYPHITQPYERLHQGSMDVRYGMGLPEGGLDAMRSAVDKIRAASAAGTITAP